MDEEKQKSYIDAITEFGGPTRPIHVTQNNWEEETRKLEEDIRQSAAFEGKLEAYVTEYKLVIPHEIRHLLEYGGVITVSTESHLLLFGHKHWARYARILSKLVGTSPVLNSVARHTFGNMYRFNKLNDDGSVDIPAELLDYAEITKKVAIIGVVYHAEIHNRELYFKNEGRAAKESLLARFKKIRFN